MKKVIFILFVMVMALSSCDMNKRDARQSLLENSEVVTVENVIYLSYVARIGAIYSMELSDGKSIYIREYNLDGKKIEKGTKLKYIPMDLGAGMSSEICDFIIVE